MGQTQAPPEARLDSWKEIARYVDRDITTVQRWEKREGMPVHRHLHDKKGSVYAFRSELDTWMRSRSGELAPAGAPEPPARAAAAEPPANPPRKLPWLVLGLLLAVSAATWVRNAEPFWRSPIAAARFQSITVWDGSEQAAAISRDGRMVAFLSDRAGQMDVWITQVGSGQFHNMTGGRFPELVNPSIRTLGFSPDGTLVTFWVRQPAGTGGARIGIWAVPALGGTPAAYLEGAAEYDWSADGRRLALHTPDAGDPLFTAAGSIRPGSAPLFTAPAGLHSHFPLWAPGGESLYVVMGTLPDQLDIWRIPAGGGRSAERITSHNARVSHPVFLDRRTLLYLADTDGTGQRLFSLDTRRRIAHCLTEGLERYTSLAASADGRRLVLTLANPKTTLWRMRIGETPAEASTPVAVALTTTSGSLPRLGPDYLLHVSVAGDGESIWKLEGDTAMQLWRGKGARVLGAPAISADGRHIAFAVRQDDKVLLHAMDADGTGARVVADSLDLRGDPAWAPDGTLTAAIEEHGTPRLYRVPLDGGPPMPLGNGYAVDPVWAGDGSFVLYSGPDIGTTFAVKAARPDGSAYSLKALTLTRGAKLHGFLPGSRKLLVSRGELDHRNLWLVDLDTGTERQLTDLPAGFSARAFGVSADGHEVVVERVQEYADVALLER